MIRLAKIQQEQKEIINKKTSLVISILKIRQKENLNGLFTNHIFKKRIE